MEGLSRLAKVRLQCRVGNDALACSFHALWVVFCGSKNVVHNSLSISALLPVTNCVVNFLD
jgi:hypothetical protein